MRAMLKRLLPRGLLGRALLIAVGPLILMQLLSAYIFYNSHWDQVSKRLSLGLAGDVAVLVDSLSSMADAASRDWLFAEAARQMELTAQLEPGAILPNEPGRQTALEGELRRALLRKQIIKPVRIDEQTRKDRVVILVQLADGVLRLEVPRERLFSWTTYAFVLWNIGTTLILLGVATIFMRNQIRPVRRLARVADAFGKGREVENFKPQGAREVKLVALAFLAMKNRIQRQIAQRTAMLAGVSHDLRTPLTRMKLQLELMPEDEAVTALRQDIHDMERMLEGYLAFARGEGTEKPQPRDLGVLLGEVVSRARRGGAAVESGDRWRSAPAAASQCHPALFHQPYRQRAALCRSGDGTRPPPRRRGRGHHRRRRPRHPGRSARRSLQAILSRGSIAQPGDGRRRSRPDHRPRCRPRPRRRHPARRFTEGRPARPRAAAGLERRRVAGAQE